MKSSTRICFEIVGPPVLGGAILCAYALLTDSVPLSIDRILLGFAFYEFFGVMFGLIPSALYCVALERFIRTAKERSYPRLATVSVSAGLGAVLGCLLSLVSLRVTPVCTPLTMSMTGLSVGVFFGILVTATDEKKA